MLNHNLPRPSRAMYALEAAWAPGFDPATARCRLDIEVPENRALFLALFRHAQVGEGQGGARALFGSLPSSRGCGVARWNRCALCRGAACVNVCEADGSRALQLGSGVTPSLTSAPRPPKQALSRRGCHSSALEVAKLLLALDPGDPMGALQLVDYLAMRAGRWGPPQGTPSTWLSRLRAGPATLCDASDGGAALALLPHRRPPRSPASPFYPRSQPPAPSCAPPPGPKPRYAWLERFVEGFDGGAALALLPNFAYSLALARFEAERQGGAASTSGAPATSAAPDDDAGDAAGRASSHDSLVSAMLLHPLVVPQMMARLQGQGVGKDAHWTSLLAKPLFAGAGACGSATLAHLVSIYVERSHLLWKAQDVQARGLGWREGGAGSLGGSGRRARARGGSEQACWGERRRVKAGGGGVAAAQPTSKADAPCRCPPLRAGCAAPPTQRSRRPRAGAQRQRRPPPRRPPARCRCRRRSGRRSRARRSPRATAMTTATCGWRTSPTRLQPCRGRRWPRRWRAAAGSVAYRWARGTAGWGVLAAGSWRARLRRSTAV
jgi:hypothetical protein